MDTIDKIRAEIERRLKYTHDWLRGDEKRHPKQTSVSKNYYKMKGDERTLDALLSFLDTLEEPVCEELEEQCQMMADSLVQGLPIECAKAIPDIKECIVIAVRHGAFWQKKQMMKEAVEGYMDKDHIVTEGPFYYIRSRNLDLPNGLKEGDKVRIIIVKED